MAALVIACAAAIGCGDDGEPVCQPACPAGTRCTVDGCRSDHPPPDLAAPVAAPGPDLLPADCTPACGGASPHCNAAGVCVPCTEDRHCPPGRVCRTTGAGSQCVPGCRSDDRCSGSDTGAGDPGSPLRCCGGQCSDVSADGQNCGACGRSCARPHAVTACQRGGCSTVACAPGWGDCNPDPDDGCETNIAVDPGHCGGCDHRCALPNALAGCAGSCYVGACLFGWGDCNGVVDDGCETSLLGDNGNCGACGMNCPPAPHARTGCDTGSCRLLACDPGHLDCNGDPRDGCEIDRDADREHCGACGRACEPGLVCRLGACTCRQCSFDNALSRCLHNACVMDRCIDGWADCNHDPRDGCERDIASNPQSCGACDAACPPERPLCDHGRCLAQWLPLGVQKDVPENQLAGWSECYRGSYDDRGVSLDDLKNNRCTGQRLALACSPSGSKTLSLFAWAHRDDVLFNTGDHNDVTHSANGVAWYFSGNTSWGFAPDGDVVSRASCDTQDSSLAGGQDGDLRLCWHTGKSSVQGGWRCGRTDALNQNNNWDRILYQLP